MTTDVFHLIGGKAVGVPEVARANPARPGETVSLSPAGTEADVSSAVEAARGAQRDWAARPAPQRGRVLLDAADLLAGRREQVARDLTREEGKTLAEATGEVSRTVDLLRYHGSEGWRLGGDVLPAAQAATHVYTVTVPLGVVGVITPWNFPLAIPAWKCAPALVAGNAVVLKPAGLVPLTAHHLADVLVEAGLPPGVLNIVHGSGSVVGAALVSHPAVAAVSFTGSVGVGAGIRAAVNARGARVQLEMGGKNAVVVLDDADPAFAAGIVAAGAFGLTGQACTATSRVIATPGIHDRLVAELVEVAGRYRPGDGLDQETGMGPVVDAAQLRTDERYLRTARDQGATVVCGGDADGLLFPPAVVTDVAPDHTLATEEVFGPVLAVLRAADLDQAIALANRSRFGLAAGIVTADLGAAFTFAERAEAGVVKVNRPTTGLDLNVPFGGVKESSTNTYREQGATATDFYTWTKSVYVGVDHPGNG
ncbi:aldehyde dehydrogenase [Actinophytocola xinjiangensis]|uniref:Aldehyde dehydrogenase n=1 Tax=Actinophytocola xinjiangensis TaxID=485602 RepID=A0A7Z1AVI8_9PSEU|nr:aldehyde dehydrogenase family protein [Actinophytocola xinjiangensis]OLF07313.1 aldehyde dehydrogenase [Actinophytocola xinjiangensis]